ncbi:MAG: YdcF family protein [Nostocales cyanobacterium]|nr:MAG: YdcF family protein [Nostocales cyanobacterium]TAF12785.1 MAG: YdcF family protein [Nostocales cyanobacterium]
MKHRFRFNAVLFEMGRLRKFRLLLKNITIGCVFLIFTWLTVTIITLAFASSQPVDAFLVLGGSIRREIYVAQQAKKYTQIPILISQGSPHPCIWLIFQRESADLQKVWLENCAHSTFENFYYSIPILQSWGVHKIKLVTSGSHVFRSRIMAQILLGAHGIWVETDVVQEIGIPGNQEFLIKTILDVIRSLLWAIFSQFISPQCTNVTKLTHVDILAWEKIGFVCEHQGGIKDSRR